MVWPGVNQVVAMPCLSIRATSRSAATMPKSPREIMVGVVISRAMAGEALSKSKVRQTKCWGMGSASELSGLVDRTRAHGQHPAEGGEVAADLGAPGVEGALHGLQILAVLRRLLQHAGVHQGGGDVAGGDESGLAHAAEEPHRGLAGAPGGALLHQLQQADEVAVRPVGEK